MRGRQTSCGVIVSDGERILLGHAARSPRWDIPKGVAEPGEDFAEAAARELREETGLVGVFPRASDVTGTPPGLIGYEEHVAGKKGMHMNFVFVCDVPTLEVVPNEEFTDHRWVTLEDGPWSDAPANVLELARLAFAVPRG